MKTAAQNPLAERLGRRLGQAWRGCARLDRRAQAWLQARGWAPGFAKTALLVVKLVVLGMLAYVALWVAMLLLLAIIAGTWATRSHDQADCEEWALGDQADPKQSVFYDPINYDDDPDPRFHHAR